MSKKVGPIGGNMGEAFDDGVFDGVKKITVAIEGSVYNCISYIKIEYEKNGKLDTREHGTIRGELKEFSVDYPDEYITSVGGSYDLVTDYEAVLIKSLIFKTNTGKTSPVFGVTTGTEFVLEAKNGGKLLGFFGRSGQALDAIGGYFDTGAQGGVAPFGGNMGEEFDDGVFEGVKKITVGKEGSPYDCVSYIKIEYEKDGKFESREHGTIRGELQEFSVDYPDEYITAVGGSYALVTGYDAVLIKSLVFKTNTGKTSPTFGGKPAGTEFMMEGRNGGKLLGFFGRSGQALDAIGAYFCSLERVGPFGGKNGAAFDDGCIFFGVKKITVAVDEGNNFKYISYIKIEYEKDGKVEIREHGTIRGELKEFPMDYPNEYITSIGGSFDYVQRYKTVVITSLILKTNTGRKSPVLGGATASGKSAGTEFLLEGKNGGKLLGFFGRSGEALDAIGAYF